MSKILGDLLSKGQVIAQNLTESAKKGVGKVQDYLVENGVDFTSAKDTTVSVGKLSKLIVRKSVLESEIDKLYKALGQQIFEGGLSLENKPAMNIMDVLFTKTKELGNVNFEIAEHKTIIGDFTSEISEKIEEGVAELAKAFDEDEYPDYFGDLKDWDEAKKRKIECESWDCEDFVGCGRVECCTDCQDRTKCATAFKGCKEIKCCIDCDKKKDCLRAFKGCHDCALKEEDDALPFSSALNKCGLDWDNLFKKSGLSDLHMGSLLDSKFADLEKKDNQSPNPFKNVKLNGVDGESDDEDADTPADYKNDLSQEKPVKVNKPKKVHKPHKPIPAVAAAAPAKTEKVNKDTKADTSVPVKRKNNHHKHKPNGGNDNKK